MTSQNAPRTSRIGHWLLWWQVDPAALDAQVIGYRALPLHRTARAGAVLCLALSAALTTAMVWFGVTSADAFYDVALMLFLAGFIFFGQRWAMIVAMIAWTLEKGFGIADGVIHGHGSTLVGEVIWWCLYMHAFWFALRVERARRRGPAGGKGATAASVF